MLSSGPFPRLLRTALRIACAGLLAAGSALAAPPKHGHPAKPAATRDAAAPGSWLYGRRADVMQAAEAIAERHQLDVGWVQSTLAAARFQPQVVKAIMPPPSGSPKNWAAYRARFVEPVRIRAGTAFWDEHAATLAKAEARYGVPASLIVGVIGVETLYGRHTGGFRVLDALATLAFDFPPGRKDRSEFFRDELGEWLALASAAGLDPTEPRGSYAGALGLPQFMPSSWNRHAVDFDGDGRIDLWHSAADAIGSVANYLAQAGWTPGMPTTYDVQVPEDLSQRALLLAPDILPTFTAEDMQRLGATLGGQGAAHDGKLALVALENGDDPPTYVAGTQNFYVVTRYNWSSYYAMAVIDLGRTIEAARIAAR